MRLQRYLFPFLLILLVGLSACGGDGGSSANGGGDVVQAVAADGDPQEGEALYNQVCIACHGPNGEGIEGLGKPFASSDFIHSRSDAELLAFIKTGRPVGDPLNSTGVDMPPKGGNPALSDDEIRDIIAYMRSLQE